MSNLKAGCLIVGLILAGLALIVVLDLFFAWFQLPLMNINRQVTQQSIQYVQAHQQILMSYWSTYQTGDETVKATYQTLICQQAPLLDVSQWPAQISAFVAQHCH